MFMENLLLDREAIEAGELPAPVPAELRMSYVAVRDVGRAASRPRCCGPTWPARSSTCRGPRR